MKRVLWFLLLMGCGGSITGPALSETVNDEQKTGSITIVIVLCDTIPDPRCGGVARRLPAGEVDQ